MSESDLDFHIKALYRNGRNEKFRDARTILLWAKQNADTEFFAPLVVMARKKLPAFPEPWEIEADWYTAQRPRFLADEARFLQGWIKNFDAAPAMKFDGQKRLYQLLVDARKTEEAEKLKKQILSESRGQRFDLGMTLAADIVFDRLDRRDYKGAEREFEKSMQGFRKQAGGHLFYGLLQPYVQRCIEDRQPAAARKALDWVRIFDRSRPTILTKDISKLVKWVEGR